MKKVINNKYKELKQQRDNLFSTFKQIMDIEYKKGNLQDNVSSIAIQYGIIAEYIFNYYLNPQIQTTVLDKAVETIKDLSAKIELMHPKKDMKRYMKNNLKFYDALLVMDGIRAGSKNIDKTTIVATKKEFLSNPLLQKYMKKEIPAFIEELDEYAKTAKVVVKPEDAPVYEAKEQMKKNDIAAKALMQIENNSYVLRVLAAIENQR